MPFILKKEKKKKSFGLPTVLIKPLKLLVLLSFCQQNSIRNELVQGRGNGRKHPSTLTDYGKDRLHALLTRSMIDGLQNVISVNLLFTSTCSLTWQNVVDSFHRPILEKTFGKGDSLLEIICEVVGQTFCLSHLKWTGQIFFFLLDPGSSSSRLSVMFNLSLDSRE